MRSRLVQSVQRSLAILVFGVLGASAAFFVGAHAGAALNGRVMSLSIARMPMPHAAAAPPPAAAMLK
jgi:hypothetical protein